MKDVGLIEASVRKQFRNLNAKNNIEESDLLDIIFRKGIVFYIENEEKITSVQQKNLVEDDLEYSEQLINFIFELSELSSLEKVDIKSGLIHGGLKNT